jgi:4-hydroxybenzoate polyprenyltransferase
VKGLGTDAHFTSAIGGAATLSPLKDFAADIKIQHTLFALPWAILSAAIAGHTYKNSLTIGKIGLILLCMVAARTAAMSANRLFDAELDAKNPRTARRAIPSGRLSMRFFAAMLGISCLLFAAGCAGFQIIYHNAWPIALCVPVLAFLCGYPFIKRFSQLCHYYLGAALALAPVCAWVAVAGRLDWPPMIMFVAVLSWTAGFDILYACQDYQSDLATGTFSVPAKFGIAGALWISLMTHVVSAAAIVLLGFVASGLGMFYGIGVVAAIGLLIVQHVLVKPNDLSRLNLAFFTLNGIISVTLGSLGIIDLCLH